MLTTFKLHKSRQPSSIQIQTMEPPALKLVMIQGPRKGESIEYQPGSNIRIGRIVRGNNLPIKDSGISSNHLSIDFSSGSGSPKWILRDLDSSNGTILNGTKLQPITPHDLSDGDSIKIGEYTSILVNIVSSQDESQIRRNPRRRAAQKVSVEQVSEIRGRRGRVLKEEEEAEKGEVLDTRNRRRGPPRKARSLKSYEGGEEEEVRDGVPEILEPVADNRGRMGRVLKESEEAECDEKIEDLDNRRRAPPRKARVLKSEETGEIGLESEKEKPGLKTGTRRTRNVKNVELVVSDSMLEKIPENSGVECAEVEVKGKKKRGRTTKKNLREEPLGCNLVDELENEKETNLEEKAVIGVDEGAALNVVVVDDNKVENEGECGVEELENVEEMNIEEKVEIDVNKGTGANGVVGDDNKVEGEGGCGCGVEEGFDLEKGTLGEWFNYLELHLPKQIIDATEEMIVGMRKKAERVHEYMLEQRKAKGKVLVG